MRNLVDRILDGKDIRETVLEETDSLMEMANVVGRKVKTDVINFSFYFSDKREISHGIRVKIKWTPEKLIGETDGYMLLHGDYAWVADKNGHKVSTKEVEKARQFFKKYKVLFAAVWEFMLDAVEVQDYLRGFITFNELVEAFECADQFRDVHDLKSLEKEVREKNLFNMND